MHLPESLRQKIDFSDKGLPVIKIAELNNGISSNTSFTQGDYGEDVFVQWDDLLFSWSGNPQTSINVFRYRLPDGWLNQHIFKVTANSELVTKDFLYYWYSTFLEKWSQKMLIFGVKSSFLELGILAVQKRELIIEEVHILIQMPIFLGLLKLFVDKCRNEWYIPI